MFSSRACQASTVHDLIRGHVRIHRSDKQTCWMVTSRSYASRSYASRSYTSRGYIPQLRIPQLRIPRLHIPQLHIPRLHIPQLRIPQLHIPQLRIPQLRIPRLHPAATSRNAAMLFYLDSIAVSSAHRDCSDAIECSSGGS